VVRLNAVAQGVTVGLVAGLAYLLRPTGLYLKAATMWQALNLLGNFLIGYRVTFVVALLACLLVFCGLFNRFFIAHIYNWIAGMRPRSDGKPLS